MKRYLQTAFIGILSFATLFLSVTIGHPTLTGSAMPDMGMSMPQGPCQSSCGSQLNSIFQNQNNFVQDKKNLEPQPIQPYYIAFVAIGWSTVLLVRARMPWHLRWRPPDLITLCAVYRI